jgi:hypothetical protein
MSEQGGCTALLPPWPVLVLTRNSTSDCENAFVAPIRICCTPNRSLLALLAGYTSFRFGDRFRRLRGEEMTHDQHP